MGDYDARPKQHAGSKATAGPSADDRYGLGAIGTNLQARVIKADVVDDRTRVTIARGKVHGVRVGMEGYIKSAGGMLTELQVEEADLYTCQAFVDVTLDQLAGNPTAVINPPTKPSAPITKDTASRVIAVVIESGRTKITIARGTTHGVRTGMSGHLISADGRSGDSFEIDHATAIQSFAYLASTVDHVSQHKNVVLHPKSSSAAAPIQRRETKLRCATYGDHRV